MRRSLVVLAIASSTALAACGDQDIVDVGNGLNAVSMRDECDPASFNAALGPGACTRQGNVTFMTELTTTQRVGAWQFVPSTFSMQVGQSITARNDGGEGHTFTRVARFGGGVVPELNSASGNLVPAPECVTLPATAEIMPGGMTTTAPALSVGTAYYQCCIHPWMRTTVTVQ